MPFELGLTIGLTTRNRHKHSWVVCESVFRRFEKSLSDLNGTDVYIHSGTILGVFRELGNIFVRSRREATVQQMTAIYRTLRKNLEEILYRAGQTSLFNARVFRDLSTLASATADELVT